MTFGLSKEESLYMAVQIGSFDVKEIIKQLTKKEFSEKQINEWSRDLGAGDIIAYIRDYIEKGMHLIIKQ